MRQSHLLLALAGSLLTLFPLLTGAPARAATPAFTFTAGNVTMSSNGSTGSGASAFSLTSENGYSGSITISCNPPTVSAGVRVPYCGGGVARAYPVAANQTVTGSEEFLNYPAPEAASRPDRGGRRLAPTLALAGLLLIGFGLRRRPARWFLLSLLAVGTFASIASVSACGGSNGVVTSGTYTYTMIAEDINTRAAVTTSITVTVP